MNVVDICKMLVRSASVTPNDATIQLRLKKLLAPWLSECHQWECQGVTNSLFILGQQGPLFLWAGHTDVVPEGSLSDWIHPPFSAHVEYPWLYGRGAQDMKGNLAAMISSTMQYMQNHNHSNIRIGFALTSDEEGPAQFGTKDIVTKMQKLHLNAKWCVVGEPTSDQQLGDQLKNGRRGSCTLQLTINNQPGHVAYTDIQQNAAHQLTHVIHKILNHKWPQHPSFPPIKIHVVHLNCQSTATNVTPTEACAIINFRYPDGMSSQSIIDVIRCFMPHNAHKIDTICDHQPFFFEYSEWHEQLKKIIFDHTGVNTLMTTNGGTSDGRYLQNVCEQLIEFGSCNDRIHQTNERINLNDLETLVKIYHDFLCQAHQTSAS